ncbi:hypothetical protein [Aporhodopirellula aestuarii]|uniref:Uncharacterized protein n=1 Tax=Aporhodopirellula aestuarii TaxID=2950107 RepID=A0ABT0UC56_9BACT|nr:hypothetical protein [Aporhodopirellula aestuarii]MCM2374593.1 hypothetical protein [Aporhodopirellula aestuarii]
MQKTLGLITLVVLLALHPRVVGTQSSHLGTAKNAEQTTGIDQKKNPCPRYAKSRRGEAYQPGIAVHQSGTIEDWYKCERIRILQDVHSRAVAANFAVIDFDKRGDLPLDQTVRN